MAAISINRLFRLFVPTWLTGPIFEKELRVISRRSKYYLLRFAYLALLSVFALIAWGSMTDWGKGSAMGIQKMSEAGKVIISTITWFQFCAIQLIAVITMSTSISDEVYHGTLASLMTTPITNLQIVGGKLLSKMLHLLSLMAVSVPLLAVVRIFGGVPWGYVIAGWCITLTAGMFAGAAAMFFSALFRRAYAIILLTLAAGFVFYAILPILLIMPVGFLKAFVGLEIADQILLFANPFSTLIVCTMEMAQPGFAGGALNAYLWPVHCLIMLGLSTTMLVCCVSVVRRTSLRKAFGSVRQSVSVLVPLSPGFIPANPPSPGHSTQAPAALPTPAGPQTPQQQSVVAVMQPPAPPGKADLAKIRSITGSPLVWKKLRTPLLPRKVLRTVFLVVSLVLLSWSYIVVGAGGGLKHSETHAVYAVIFMLVGMTATAVLAATSISTEKETRTLPILLTTPLSDWHIIGASIVEVFRRSLPIWVFLLVHMAISSLLRVLHPIVCLHIVMLVASVIAFLTGTGLYFSSRYKRTTQAVVMNLAVGIGIWAILPGILSLLGFSTFRSSWMSEVVTTANPLVQAAVVTAGGGYFSLPMTGRLEYFWPIAQTGPAGATLIMLVSLAGYSLLGFLFLWRAKCILRRDLF